MVFTAHAASLIEADKTLSLNSSKSDLEAQISTGELTRTYCALFPEGIDALAAT
jgi:hypothetical protein